MYECTYVGVSVSECRGVGVDGSESEGGGGGGSGGGGEVAEEVEVGMRLGMVTRRARAWEEVKAWLGTVSRIEEVKAWLGTVPRIEACV